MQKDELKYLQKMLNSIITEGSNRQNLIRQFQNKIWDMDDEKEDALFEILSELAYDLDFYEANEIVRKEDPSFYGDERLILEIRNALNKIIKLSKQ